MISKKLEEKFNYHSNDKSNDMWLHFEMLKNVAIDSNIIMELGTRGIVSTWAFLYGLAGKKEKIIHISKNRKELVMEPAQALWSYDINHPKEYGVDIKEIEEIAIENDIEWRFIQEDTTKTTLPPCDSIFFDTDHTYKQLSQELKLHANKARKYLVFHDTTHYAIELIPAINEFLKEEGNEEWHILHCKNQCHGLSILARAPLSKIKEWAGKDD